MTDNDRYTAYKRIWGNVLCATNESNNGNSLFQPIATASQCKSWIIITYPNSTIGREQSCFCFCATLRPWNWKLFSIKCQTLMVWLVEEKYRS